MVPAHSQFLTVLLTKVSGGLKKGGLSSGSNESELFCFQFYILKSEGIDRLNKLSS